jgi:hypothetical protein
MTKSRVARRAWLSHQNVFTNHTVWQRFQTLLHKNIFFQTADWIYFDYIPVINSGSIEIFDLYLFAGRGQKYELKFIKYWHGVNSKRMVFPTICSKYIGEYFIDCFYDGIYSLTNIKYTHDGYL